MANAKARDVDRGWAWVVMAAACVTQILIGIFMYSLGVMQIVLLETFEEGLAKTSWILSLVGCFLCLPGPLTGFLMTATSCRTTMLIGTFFVFSGLAASSFVTELDHLYITLSTLAGVGSGLIYSPDLVVLGFYFDKYMSLATAIVVTGGGIGMLIGAPIVSALESEFGWRGMFLILAGLFANMAVCSIICRPNSVEMSYWDKGDQSSSGDSKSLDKEKSQDEKDPSATSCNFPKLPDSLQVVTRPSVVAFCCSMFLWNVSISLVNLHLQNFVVQNGVSVSDSSFLFTSMGVCNILSRLLAGFSVSAGFVNKNILYVVSFGLMGLLDIGLPFVPITLVTSMVYAGVFGLLCGGPYVVITTITKDLVGLSHLPVVFGAEMLIGGMGALLGPPIAGGLTEACGGSYTWSFVFAGITCILSSLLGLFLLRAQKPTDDCVLEISLEEVVPGSRHSMLFASQLSLPGVPSPYLEPRSRHLRRDLSPKFAGSPRGSPII